MLTADTDLQVVSSRATLLNTDLHQLANPTAIDARKRVRFDDFQGLVAWQERSGVVTAHAQCCLGQVVGTEGEELGGFSDFIGCNCTAWYFDHRTDGVLELLAGCLHHFSSYAMDDFDL